jgi:multidrug efflux system membrane fusion protein
MIGRGSNFVMVRDYSPQSCARGRGLSQEPSMRCPRTAIALAVALAALATSACTPGGRAESAGAPPGSGRGGGAAPVPVVVGGVVQKAMPLDVRGIGTVEAASNVAIRAQITGALTSVNFKDGDDVTDGQLLFTIDHRPLEAALKQAEANLQRDIAQAANAREQAKRFSDLAARGIATREQVDTSRANVQALEGTLGADQAAVENARVQLEYATIKAPISGRTGVLMAFPGNLVRANDTTPLVVINQISPIRVAFAVPEAQLARLKRYMALGDVYVEAVAPNEPPAVGRITFTDNAVDQTTGTIKVKGTFPNSDHRLWPGQYVNVVVKLATDPNAIVVDTVAVQTGPQGSYVYVVKADQTVELRPVEVGRVVGAETIVASGLSAGETVVTDGHLRLVPGSRVSRKDTPSKVTP